MKYEGVYDRMGGASYGHYRQLCRTVNDEPELCAPDVFAVDPVVQEDETVIYIKQFWRFMRDRITPREEKVLHMRYWMGMTFEEVGSGLDITGERARQIEKLAFRRIRLHCHTFDMDSPWPHRRREAIPPVYAWTLPLGAPPEDD